MTIDEAIKHARVSSERLTRLGNAEKALEQPCYKVTLEQAKEHEQLAEWLEDYKRLKSEKEQDIYERAYRDGQDKGLSDGHFAGYNKAIDDFEKSLIGNSRTEVIDGRITLIVTEKRIKLIAEQLKAGAVGD